MRLHHNKRTILFDRTILLTLGLTCLIGLFITGYKHITFQNCSSVNFVVRNGELVAGKLVSFKGQTLGADEWKWTFGDKSETATTQEALHVYQHPGEYQVTLQVNSSCSYSRKVTIHKNKPVTNTSRYPTFSMPATANVGDEVQFTDNTEGAQKWEWSFGESMQVDATTQNPTYVFQSSGIKTITLIVNGKEKYATKKSITVFAEPIEKPEFDLAPPQKVELKTQIPKDTIQISEVPAAPPLQPIQPQKKPELSRIQLEDYLLQIAEEKKKPSILNPYTCNGFNTRVRANGEELRLNALLQQFTGKKVKIKNLDIVKQKGTGCIDYIKIDYKKNKLFGIF